MEIADTSFKDAIQVVFPIVAMIGRWYEPMILVNVFFSDTLLIFASSQVSPRLQIERTTKFQNNASPIYGNLTFLSSEAFDLIFQGIFHIQPFKDTNSKIKTPKFSNFQGSCKSLL